MVILLDPLLILIAKENKRLIFIQLKKLYPLLTRTQANILRLLANGYSYVDTASVLGIKKNNIYAHIDGIPKRLQRKHAKLDELYQLLKQ